MSVTPLHRPRMRDVAELAGVSTQTVSNFLNGRTARLSPVTRARVEAAIEELGYRRSDGRGGQGRPRRSVGFLVNDSSRRCLADPLTALYLSGVNDVARECGYSVLVHSATLGPEQVLRPALDREIAGAVLVLSGPRADRIAIADAAAGTGLPFVLLDEVLPRSRRHYPTVLADQRDGARRLVAHLVARGHRRIAFLAAASQWAVLEERYAGYRSGLDEHGLRPDSALTLFEGGWEPDEVDAAVDTLLALPDPPTAILCGSDLVALGAMRRLLDVGCRVPDDVAVCGFDDFVFASHAAPALTTVAVPAWEMGRTACRLLLTALTGHRSRRAEHVLPVELRLRGSA